MWGPLEYFTLVAPADTIGLRDPAGTLCGFLGSILTCHYNTQHDPH